MTPINVIRLSSSKSIRVAGPIVEAGALRRFAVAYGMDMLDGTAARAVRGDGLGGPMGRIFFADSTRASPDFESGAYAIRLTLG